MVRRWLHMMIGIVLLVAVIMGLVGPSAQMLFWTIVARTCYILIIVSGLVMIRRGWRKNKWLLIVKIVAAYFFIWFAETGFAHRTGSAANLMGLCLPLVLGVVTVAIGFALSDGSPIRELFGGKRSNTQLKGEVRHNSDDLL